MDVTQSSPQKVGLEFRDLPITDAKETNNTGDDSNLTRNYDEVEDGRNLSVNMICSIADYGPVEENRLKPT